MLDRTQKDTNLSDEAKARWKHEIKASNARIQEMKDRPDFKTTMEDRAVFMAHMTLAQQYANLVQSREGANPATDEGVQPT